jgi:hypothetical protein
MFPWRQIASAMLAAWGFGGLLLWAVRWVTSVPMRVLLSALALACAELAGFWALEGRPHFPLVEAVDWFMPVAFGAALLAVIAFGLPVWWRLVVVAAACPWAWARIVVFPMPGYTFDGSVFWMALLGLGTAVVWVAVASTAHCVSPSHARLMVAIAAGGLMLSLGGTGVALMLSGSLRLGELALMTAAMAGAAVASGRAIWPGGALLVPSALLMVLLISGCFYAELPVSSAVLLGAAPACVRISRGWWRVALVVGLVALGVWLAFENSPPLDA